MQFYPSKKVFSTQLQDGAANLLKFVAHSKQTSEDTQVRHGN